MPISRRAFRACILLGTLFSLVLSISGPPAAATVQHATAASGTQTLIEPPEDFAGAGFGEAVAIDGELLAVSAPNATVEGVSSAGAVYLYRRDPQSPTSWTQIRTLHRDSPVAYSNFGKSLALQGDTLIVGVPQDPRDGGTWQGATFVYERNQGGPDAWGLVTQLADETTGKFRLFGNALAIDGDLVAVSVGGKGDIGIGSPDSVPGKVLLYSRAAGWARVGALSDPNGQIKDNFGSAIVLAGDTLVIGAMRADADSTQIDTGAVFVYGRDQGGAGQWGLVTKLTADAPSAKSAFGRTLALAGDTLVVGALNETRVVPGQPDTRSTGAAFIYGRDQGGAEAWGLVAALRPTDSEFMNFYGTSLALAGDELWIGAPGSNVGGFDRQGILYHYARDQGGANAWGALPLIAADGGVLRDEFGTSLAISDDTLLAGTPNRNAVYVINIASTPDQSGSSVFLPLSMQEWAPPTGTLVDGGVVAEPSGAIIGAVPGSLDAPINATIRVVHAPAEPLPNGFVPRGDDYLVSAERLTIAPADKPLLVGLPVPDGADTTKLAVAAFIPDSMESESEPTEAPTRSWATLPGSYDTATKLFVVTLRALLPEGATLTLFEHPDNTPLPMPQQAATRERQQTPVEYRVACAPISQGTDACTSDNFALVQAEMEAAHHEFVDTHGFKSPALIHLAGVFSGPDKQPQLKEIYHSVVVRTNPCVDKAGESFIGRYNPVLMRIVICMDAQSTADDIRRTVRHELFHAIQASYPNVAKDYLTPESSLLTQWLIEGTAAAAEQSGFLMLRSPDFTLREATEPLTSTAEEYEYSTQDFWVYTGLEGEQSDHYISYLQAIFAKGATPEHVNQAIPLDDAYWEWAKNQVIEHHQPMIDAFVNGPCQLEARTVPANTKFIFYPGQITVDGVLPPLTSALVVVNVRDARLGMPVSAKNNTDEKDLRYKVYGKDEAGCRVVPDGRRQLTNIPAESTIYVLVSNVSLTEEFTYVVEVD